MEIKKERKEIGRECKFAVHMPVPKDMDVPDFHYVKERIHYDDGTTEPAVRIIKDYERTFYLTSPSKRNHNDKKEWEHVDNLIKYTCTQSQLRGRLARALGMTWSSDTVRKLANSPYVYGTDISSTSFIKMDYRKKNPDLLTAETYAVLDIETNMIEKNEEPIMCTVIFNDQVRIAILNKMVAGYADKETRFNAAVEKYVHDFVRLRNLRSDLTQFYEDKIKPRHKQKLISFEQMAEIFEKAKEDQALQDELLAKMQDVDKEHAKWSKDDIVEKHDLKVEVAFVDTQRELFSFCFDFLHETKPDFLAIWNMDFDIPRILAALKKEGVDPSDIFCDPKIPKERRVFRYKQDNPKKTTSSGVVKSKSNTDLWHTLFCTSSFYVIDAMCAYRFLRLGNQEESSYALDAILAKILKGRVQKLKFPEADAYSGPAWHEFMQRNYIFEYAAYNIFDCLCMIFLDEKTKDMRLTFHTSAFISDFENFKSLPKRITDALYFDLLPEGWILGDAGAGERKKDEEEDVEEDDKDDDDDPYSMYNETLSLAGWIDLYKTIASYSEIEMVKDILPTTSIKKQL